MYHSDTLEEIFDFTHYQDDPEAAKTLERIKIVWHYCFGISKWMQSSLQGEREAQILVKESCIIAQKIRDERVKKLVEIKEAKKAEELKRREEEEKRRLKSIKETPEENKEVHHEEAKKLAVSSMNIKVAASKDTNKAKKRNRTKLATQLVIPKNKKKNKNNKKEEKAQPVEEDKKEEVEKEEDHKEDTPVEPVVERPED
jgi:hypothetical protein